LSDGGGDGLVGGDGVSEADVGLGVGNGRSGRRRKDSGGGLGRVGVGLADGDLEGLGSEGVVDDGEVDIAEDFSTVILFDDGDPAGETDTGTLAGGGGGGDGHDTVADADSVIGNLGTGLGEDLLVGVVFGPTEGKKEVVGLVDIRNAGVVFVDAAVVSRNIIGLVVVVAECFCVTRIIRPARDDGAADGALLRSILHNPGVVADDEEFGGVRGLCVDVPLLPVDAGHVDGPFSSKDERSDDCQDGNDDEKESRDEAEHLFINY